VKASMKIGDLYKCTWKRTWVLHQPQSEDWTGAVCIYLGPEIVYRADGYKVINHRFLVNGKERVVDKTMLRYMQKIG
jgi:hypothetical protein